MRKAIHTFLLSAGILASGACGPSGGSDGGGDGDDDGDGSGTPDAAGFIDAREIDEFADAGGMQSACNKMDILFVVDNSGSMGEEQMNLAANFPMFATLIDTYTNSAGQTLDYHVALTTTDRTFTENAELIPGFPIPTPHEGNDGKFQTGTGCSFPAGRRYLQKGDSLASILPCVANVGIGGDASEMPLEATKLALIDRIQDGYNSGFLREDALLAIVMITDENDCSVPGNNITSPPPNINNPEEPLCTLAVPVSGYISALDNLKGGERGRWAVAVIAGPGPGECTSSFGSAAECTRLKDFVQMSGQNAVFSSICDGNLAMSLQQAFETFGEACEEFPPIGRETAPYAESAPATR